MGDDLDIQEIDGGVRFAIRVSPRASRDAVAGLHDCALRIRTTAPPVDGAANAAVRALLSKRLRVPKSAVRVVSGETGRSKRVEVLGASVADVRALI